MKLMKGREMDHNFDPAMDTPPKSTCAFFDFSKSRRGSGQDFDVQVSLKLRHDELTTLHRLFIQSYDTC